MARIKERLKNGETLVGTMVTLVEHPDIVKVIQVAGFDYLVMDNEHGSFDYSTLARICSVARAVDFPLVIRIPECRREIVLKYMEMGAHGLLLPNCEDPETARSLVDFSKYAPLGNRGVSLLRGHTGYRAPASATQYMAESNEETLIMCQIESQRAVENVEAILDVEGVDAAFIGPNDLSQSFGLMGQFTHPTIEAAMDRVLGAAKARGKYSGVHYTGGVEMLQPWIAKGMSLNLWTNDITMMLNNAKEGLGKLRAP
ncbi:MAG: aldolase/citrate lyase family protein [Treponema sp.]|nr:aldolase/citrate lyase family protein [Treponema sp.]